MQKLTVDSVNWLVLIRPPRYLPFNISREVLHFSENSFQFEFRFESLLFDQIK